MIHLQQMLALTSRGNHPRHVLTAAIGLFVAASAERGAALPAPLEWYLTRIRRGVELDQIKFYFDRFGRYCGHVWWTQAPATRESSLLKLGTDGLSADDFSLQGDAWLIDLNAQHGALPGLLLDMRDTVLAHCPTLTYFRHKTNRRIAKRISRDSKAFFFHKPRESRDSSHDRLSSDHDLRLLAISLMDKFIDLGMALTLLGQQPRFARMPLSLVFNRIRHPLELRQYRLLLSAIGEPAGFFSWAWLDASDRVANGFRPLRALEEYEWNEGPDLFLCDAVTPPSGIHAMMDHLVDEWHPNETVYFYPPIDDGTAVTALTPLSPGGRSVLRCIAPTAVVGLDVLQSLAALEDSTC